MSITITVEDVHRIFDNLDVESLLASCDDKPSLDPEKLAEVYPKLRAIEMQPPSAERFDQLFKAFVLFSGMIADARIAAQMDLVSRIGRHVLQEMQKLQEGGEQA